MRERSEPSRELTKRAGAHPAHAPQAEPPPARSSLLQRNLLRMQRTAGNRVVVQRLFEKTPNEPAQLERVPSLTDWLNFSKMMRFKSELNRSDPLVKIDDTIDAYDKIRDTELNYNALDKKLADIQKAITDWKISKGSKKTEGGLTVPTEAWVSTGRADIVQKLEAAVPKERIIQQHVADDRAAQKKQATASAIDKILTPGVAALTNETARAKAVFQDYMAHFRGKAVYTLKTQQGVTIWDNLGSVACATISQGLVDALRHVGLHAKVKQIAPSYFVTKPVAPGVFIDSAVTGNVRPENGNFADELRFYFSNHWIVQTEHGVNFDPTSGIEVTDGTEIVDEKFRLKKSGELFVNKDHTLYLEGDTCRHGGGYVLDRTADVERRA